MTTEKSNPARRSEASRDCDAPDTYYGPHREWCAKLQREEETQCDSSRSTSSLTPTTSPGSSKAAKADPGTSTSQGSTSPRSESDSMLASSSEQRSPHRPATAQVALEVIRDQHWTGDPWARIAELEQASLRTDERHAEAMAAVRARAERAEHACSAWAADLLALAVACGQRGDEYPRKAVERRIADLESAIKSTIEAYRRRHGKDGFDCEHPDPDSLETWLSTPDTADSVSEEPPFCCAECRKPTWDIIGASCRDCYFKRVPCPETPKGDPGVHRVLSNVTKALGCPDDGIERDPVQQAKRLVAVAIDAKRYLDLMTGRAYFGGLKGPAHKVLANALRDALDALGELPTPTGSADK